MTSFAITEPLRTRNQHLDRSRAKQCHAERRQPAGRIAGYQSANLLLLLMIALALVACRRPSALPHLFPVPDAHLVNEAGKPVHLGEMKGYVTVYDFIFTNCAGSCPMMTATMRKVTEKIDKSARVRFVSISVDPARDTPAALAEYAKRVRNDDRWTFLTGQRDDVVRLSVDGFKLAAGGDPEPGSEPILHSAKFAVADREGVIREYYGATNDDAVDHVAATVRDLLLE